MELLLSIPKRFDKEVNENTTFFAMEDEKDCSANEEGEERQRDPENSRTRPIQTNRGI